MFVCGATRVLHELLWAKILCKKHRTQILLTREDVLLIWDFPWTSSSCSLLQDGYVTAVMSSKSCLKFAVKKFGQAWGLAFFERGSCGPRGPCPATRTPFSFFRRSLSFAELQTVIRKTLPVGKTKLWSLIYDTCVMGVNSACTRNCQGYFTSTNRLPTTEPERDVVRTCIVW